MKGSLTGTLRLILTSTLIGGGVAVILRPSVPPKGFNSFDSYGQAQGTTLNCSTVLDIAMAMSTELLPAGYDTLVIDGGWSISIRPF